MNEWPTGLTGDLNARARARRKNEDEHGHERDEGARNGIAPQAGLS